MTTNCADVPRPCPYVSCRYHLYLTVRHSKKSDNIWINFPMDLFDAIAERP